MGVSVANVKLHDARELLEEVASGVGALAAESGVELRVQAQQVEVEVDRDRITQTLVNLVGNAVKFAPAGSEVVLACRATDGGIEFEVRDFGPGIPPELVSQIFEPFTQVNRSDAQELGGSGLGLAISKGLVEQHGGRIWVESKLGEGSAFKFVLPLQQPSPQPRN